MHQLLEMVNADEKKKLARQNFVFSATLSMVHDIPAYLLKKKRKKKLSPTEKLREITEVIGVKEKAKVVDLTTEKGKGVIYFRILVKFLHKLRYTTLWFFL